jgi:hypothetical protein
MSLNLLGCIQKGKPKKKYKSEAKALRHLARIRKKRLAEGAPLSKGPKTCYLCSHCGHWHLSSKSIAPFGGLVHANALVDRMNEMKGEEPTDEVMELVRLEAQEWERRLGVSED